MGLQEVTGQHPALLSDGRSPSSGLLCISCNMSAVVPTVLVLFISQSLKNTLRLLQFITSIAFSLKPCLIISDSCFLFLSTVHIDYHSV